MRPVAPRRRSRGRRARARDIRGALLLATLLPALAPALAWEFAPSVTVRETHSDNVSLDPAGIARSGWYTDVIPVLRAEHSGARARGFLDLRVDARRHAGDTSADETRRFLESQATVDAIERRLSIDVRADITQQNLSAFGAASTPDQPSASRNQVETRVLRVSPWLRGGMPGFALYRVRFDAADIRAGDSSFADTRTAEWTARIATDAPGSRIGWAADASALEARNDVVGTIVNRRVRAALSFALTPLLKVSALEGVETTDFAGPSRDRSDTPGFGVQWTPSARTRLSALVERRFFGDGHAFAFSHRTPRMAFRVGSVRDAAVLPGTATGAGSPGRALMADLFAPPAADPFTRLNEGRRRLEETGIAAFSALGSSVLDSRPVVHRTTEASAAWTGPRDTVTVTAAQRDQRALGAGLDSAVPSPSDDFRQRGLDASWAHRLTRLATLTVAATALRTVGEGEGAPRTDERRATLSLASRLGRRTVATLGVRHVRLDAAQGEGSFRENAVFAFVSARF